MSWGNNFGVTWYRGKQLRFARVDENADLLAPPITIYNSPSDFAGRAPSIIYADGQWHIAFVRRVNTYSHVFVRRVDSSGNTVGATLQVTSGKKHYLNPRLAIAGQEIGLGYFRAEPGNARSVHFQRMSTNGSTIGAPHEVYTSTLYADFLNLVWSGKFFGFSWVQDNKIILFQRVKTDGTKKGGLVTVFTSKTSAAVLDLMMISRDAKAYALVFRWQGPTTSTYQAYFMRQKKNGKKKGVLRQVSHATSGVLVDGPTLVWDRLVKRYGVFWSDNRTNPYDLYATKLNVGGGIVVSDYQFTNSNPQDRWPKIVSNGDVALLTYSRFGPPFQIFVCKLIVEFW